MSLYRLIYSSVSSIPPARFEDEMNAIVDVSAVRNGDLGITGMLVASRRHFLQVLEGRRSVLSDLYGRILGDPRHGEVEIIEAIPVEQRCFPQWSMGCFALGGESAIQVRRFSTDRNFDPALMTPGMALNFCRALASSQSGSSQYAPDIVLV